MNVVAFFMVGCGPCIQKKPAFAAASGRPVDTGVVILEWTGDNGVRFTEFTYDPNNPDRKVSEMIQAYGINMFPTLGTVDKSGRFRAFEDVVWTKHELQALWSTKLASRIQLYR
jgi:hypothetical protein